MGNFTDGRLRPIRCIPLPALAAPRADGADLRMAPCLTSRTALSDPSIVRPTQNDRFRDRLLGVA